jgi:uncharacterized protein (UPF0332 family)
MDATTFLAHAADLAARAAAAECRSAVSRAYYAAFHAAREFLKQIDVQVPRAIYRTDHGP